MGYPTKIATCCYCGTRAALVLGRDRHELSCSSCGAPLHDMKRLKDTGKKTKKKREYVPYGSHPSEKPDKYKDYNSAPRKSRRKKKKGLLRYVVEEAFDVLDDIFD